MKSFLNVTIVVKTIVRDILHNVISGAAADPNTIQSTQKKDGGIHLSSKTLSDWRKKFPWLLLHGDNDERRMCCAICQSSELNLTSVWANAG